MKRVIPLVVFMVLVAFFSLGLKKDPHNVPSPLIGKPAPDFRLWTLNEPARQITPADMRGKVWLLNVWASWCSACRAEHEVLLDLAKQNVVPVYGLDYKDQPQDAQTWLDQLGNPYTATLVDQDGRTGINYGVYGVPETYIIDKNGVIRQKLTGAVTPENLAGLILPLVRELQK